MTTSTQPGRVFEFYTLRKDVGVAILVLVALALGAVLRMQMADRTTTFEDPGTHFRISYPATWGTAESLGDVLLKVENPRTASPFKTTLTVLGRGIDAASPPTLQQLVDRRVAQNAALTGYHFLASKEATVGGAKAMRQEYAYVVQPIDEPRRASFPVVVDAVEYIVVTRENVFYITLAAPEADAANAGAQLAQMIQTVQAP